MPRMKEAARNSLSSREMPATRARNVVTMMGWLIPVVNQVVNQVLSVQAILTQPGSAGPSISTRAFPAIRRNTGPGPVFEPGHGSEGCLGIGNLLSRTTGTA